jgi:hypothetical protein
MVNEKAQSVGHLGHVMSPGRGAGLITTPLMAMPVLGLAIALMIVPLTGCGGSTLDSLNRKAMKLMKELLGVLQGVTDEASARAAVEKIKVVGDKMNAQSAELRALNPKPTPKEQMAVSDRYGAEFIELDHAIANEMRRIRKNPALKVHVDEARRYLPADLRGR